MTTTPIVVGTDGAASSDAAVRWATHEAVRRDATLRILHAFDETCLDAHYDSGAEYVDVARQLADATVVAAVTLAGTTCPDVRTEAVLLVGNPVPHLMEAAADAAMMVLGNRGRGGFTSLLLGSVSQRIASSAPCPVVIVGGRGDVTEGPVVVGVEDSTADPVLESAFELAAARHCSLVVVRSYVPPMPLWIGDLPVDAFPTPAEAAAERDRLDAQVDPWRQKYPQVTVEILLSRDGPASVLVGISHTAQLVVVGNQGHGALTGSLLGSTGLQLLHHAHCPVMIVRPIPQR